MKAVTRKGWAAAALVLGAGALGACGESEAMETDFASDVAPVERRAIEVRAEAAGEIQPIRIVEVKSKASGEILELHVETGDFVRRGDLLAVIDPRDVRNALAQAEADREVARARLATAESQRQRSAELLAANVITQREYENAALEEANARAQLVKAETSLELARERMGDVTIRAPMDGTIIQRDVEVGQIIASASQNISGGTTLLLMADLAEMQVRMLVDETDIGKVATSQPARVTVEAYPNRVFRGEIFKVEPRAVVEQNVTMFPVLVHLDNREGLLKPGMNAEVEVEIARRDDAVAVPNAAVVSMRDVAAASEVLGLDADAVREALRASAQRRAAHDADSPAPAEEPADECAALAAQVRASGGPASLNDADRAKLRECMQRAGGSRGAARGTRGPSTDGEVRPGVVFVRGSAGPEPRSVMLGLNDWDYSEVVSGLEPGEQVILMSVARLQQQQQQMLDRFRQRQGGPFPGAR